MATLNKKPETVKTHEGGTAQRVDAREELERTVMTCLLWEDAFYESGESIADRIVRLVKECSPSFVADLAVKARNEMLLRHVPLLLVREIARNGNGSLVEDTLREIIQRPDELTEYLSIYWKDGKEPLSAGSKRGLAGAFPKFNAYQLAKYDRDTAVKLRDVLFLCHAKPNSEEQAEVWRKLVDKTLEAPDTWEVALSSGANKKETWERLLREKKLGGLAVLRNLRNMQNVEVDISLIKNRLTSGIKKALPFRFITAARYAPRLEDALEVAMLKGMKGMTKLNGSTGLLVDVSGSMSEKLSNRGETTRMDAASGLAILLREVCEDFCVATFSQELIEIPPRRGFALRDAIHTSQNHLGTYLKHAQVTLSEHFAWKKLDRMIVITDEQSHDGCATNTVWSKGYIINVAPYQNGIGYGNGWVHVNGWSERIVDYIIAREDQE